MVDDLGFGCNYRSLTAGFEARIHLLDNTPDGRLRDVVFLRNLILAFSVQNFGNGNSKKVLSNKNWDNPVNAINSHTSTDRRSPRLSNGFSS